MESMSKQEEEFLRKVYCKVNYLQFEKKLQDLIRENEKMIKKKKIRGSIVLSLLAGLSIVFIAIMNFDASVFLIICTLLMLAAAYYEFVLEI